MKKIYMICIVVALLIPLGAVLEVEARHSRVKPFADGAAYYSYRDHSVYLNANKLRDAEIYQIYLDLDGNHTTSAVAYVGGWVEDLPEYTDLGAAYTTPDGCTTQFTWGAVAGDDKIDGFPCVIRAVRKQLIDGEQVETPLGEWFKWTYRGDGVFVLHLSNSR